MLFNYSTILVIVFMFKVLDHKFKSISSSAPITTDPKPEKVVACYIDRSSVKRNGRAAFDIEDVDSSLCTEIIYGFAELGSDYDEIVPSDPLEDLTESNGKGGYEKVVALKEKYPHLKVILGIGRFHQGNFSKMVRDPAKRKNFVTSSVQFLRKYKFDGLNLVWTFTKSDKLHFTSLVKEMRSAFNNGSKLLLTAVFGPVKTTMYGAYDVQNLASYLDYIHINSLNYHGAWEQKTGPSTPLVSSDAWNVAFTVNYLIKLGVQPEKLVLGISFSGTTFILTNRTSLENFETMKWGVPTKSVGFQSQYIRSNILMGYNEICLLLHNSSAGFGSYWDKESCTPFAISGENFISYDNEKSIFKKIEFSIKRKLAGVMVWALDYDDFRGDCGSENYPLLRSVNTAIELTSKDVYNGGNVSDAGKIKNISLCLVLTLYITTLLFI